MSLVVVAFIFWLSAWGLNIWITHHYQSNFARFIVPVLFGMTIIIVWELLVRGLKIPSVLLPAPTAILRTFANSLPILWEDFVQTVLKGALTGYIMGCSFAFFVAILLDKSSFLRRGLLPIGNFVAALPIIGMAPILVMWFGFDWQSKAAIVVVMVFFPMLINCFEGLQSASQMQRDLMRTYGASYWAGLAKLRIPAAMPFIFNGLKICSTLALIGAIVAEFFGSPVKGMGFRISTSVGQLNLEMVWAEIMVAAIAGTGVYGLLVLLERKVTFWHPSQQGRS